MPAVNDLDNVKEGGKVIEVLAKKFGPELTGQTTFPDMQHGWMTRGDPND